MTTFDLSSSPVYLGGIADVESHFLEDVVPSKQSFVGAIQKVVLNGAELVLAGGSQKKSDRLKETQLEHWEATTQWQGPPCGDNYSTCAKDRETLKRICRPLGSSYECSCSTPLTHMSFVRHLTASLGDVDLLHNLTAQREISAKAEAMACDALATRLGMASKDLQHDVPGKDNEIGAPLSEEERKEVQAGERRMGDSREAAVLYKGSVLFSGSTVINYHGLIDKDNTVDNVRIQLKTETSDGLVVMIPERSHGMEEFVAISLVSGRPEACLSLRSSHHSPPLNVDTSHSEGKRVTTLKAAQFVADGDWHIVHFIRNRGHISLIVDDQMVSGELAGTDGVLNNEGNIWLGGALERVTTLPWQYQRNFTGCISALFLNEVSIALLGDADLLYGTIASCS
ncbi:unnamed protein product [Hydatigera taeniaeformis]|uniref:Laminin G domain-containing protein n=1 Tax=Hydatigena taeniaeformis TaxID=6205 RepID=A0A3P7G553_HYDTA|nr:unnamed protein product [Hydatigera taeniaeformis]